MSSFIFVFMCFCIPHFFISFFLSVFLCFFIPSLPLSWNRCNLCCCSGKGISAKLHILCSEVQKKNGEAYVMAINWALEARLLHMRLVLLLGCRPYMFRYIGGKLIFLPLPLRRTFIFPSFISFSPRTTGNKVIRRSSPRWNDAQRSRLSIELYSTAPGFEVRLGTGFEELECLSECCACC